MRIATVVAGAFLALLLLAAPAAAGPTDWTQLRALNITHQGGEDEAPSATMYAFERSMRLGSDMLEVDIHATADGRLAVIHDGTVDRTTNGTGDVSAMTMDELRQLDAAHWFVPGENATKDAPEEQYVFRGVATGERKPPPGYRASDFRVLELDELIGRYPDVPINIEIKGSGDADIESFLRNAEVLAAYLNGLGRTEGIMVASFNDAALQRFHELAPDIDLAPAIGGVAGYAFGNVPPPPGTKAFQVPMSFQGIPVTNEQFVARAHADGYGVHVWTINDEERMNSLFDMGVDGIMTAEPMRLEKVMCAREEPRPPLPASVPGKHCTKKSSIACEVKATELEYEGRRARVTLVRHDPFGSKCAGKVVLRAQGTKVKSSHRFSFGWAETGENTAGAESMVRIKLRKRTAANLAENGEAKVTAAPWDGYPRRAELP
jgi:glycerophosphoryl diester phosphodiesterase